MKIAFIVQTFPSLSETFILNQITGLIDLGHEVDIYARSVLLAVKTHQDIEKYKLYGRTCCLEPVPANKAVRILKAVKLLAKSVHKRPLTFLASFNVFKFGRDALSLNLFYAVLPFMGRTYDILHCHFGPNGNFGAMLKKMGIGLKLVTMFHGHDIRKGLKEGGQIYKPLFRTADCLLANTPYAHKHLIDFGADPQKIIVHPEGIDIQKFPYRDRRPNTGEHDPIIILTVARLVHERGLPQGIRAVRKLLDSKPDLHLRYHIVGEGLMEEELRKLVDELGLNGTVRFLGGMVQSDVIREFQKADIFLLPSVEEALGVVLLEAQAIGLPVLATDVGSVRQALRDGESGYLVPPENPDLLAQRLIGLLEHRDRWPEMGRAGRMFVEKYYDIRNLNRRLEEIFENLSSS